MILVLHHRYRTTGGEERAVEDLAWLAREHLGEDVEMLTRDSAAIGRGRAAAGLLAGGLDPGEVAAAVRRTKARVVHAHNVHPSFGWRALAAAREAGARVVLHLHNYRLVCAVATCVEPNEQADCTRCHGRNTAPGVLHRCRGARSETLAYAVALGTWQRRMVQCADAMIVPSASALERLQLLGAPLGDTPVHVVPHVLRETMASAAPVKGGYALVASRLAIEKGVDVAVEACARAGLELVVAGDGPLAAELRTGPGAAAVRFFGRVDDVELARLRAGAAVALVPTRAAETFGLAAVEAMGAGLPVVASDIGALRELAPAVTLVPPGDAAALATAARAVAGDQRAGQAGLEVVNQRFSPAAVAPALAAALGA